MAKKRLAAGPCGNLLPAARSAIKTRKGCLIKNAPTNATAMNIPPTEKATANAATIGSKTIPHAPCSVGNAMPFSFTLGVVDSLTLIVEFSCGTICIDTKG